MSTEESIERPINATAVGEPLVQFNDVSKAYRLGLERANVRAALPGRLGARVSGDVHEALQSLSLTLRRGESLGIIGHNGAGKSTLLKLVARVTAPTSGSVEVRGRTAALIELGAGFHPDMTGRENIGFSAAVLGMSRTELRSRTDEIIEFAGIDQFLDTPVKRYSSGMLARLGFSVAAHLDADVVVLDEVLSVGDAAFQRRCHDQIRRLREAGTALLYVTHALWSVPLLCSQAILLQAGRVIASGDTENVLAAYDSSAVRFDKNAAGRAFIRRLSLSEERLGVGADIGVSAEIEVEEAICGGYVLMSIHAPDRTVVAAEEFTPRGLVAVGMLRLDISVKAPSLAPGNYFLYVSIVASHDQPVVEHQRRIDFVVDGRVRSADLFGHTSLAVECVES